MSEGREIVLSDNNRPPKKWLPGPVRNAVDHFIQTRDEKRQKEKVLSENERALRQMSDIAQRVIDLMETPDFQAREDAKFDSSFGINRYRGHVYVEDDGHGIEYSINTERDFYTRKPTSIEVYTGPSVKDNYMSGRGDGYYRIGIMDDHQGKIKTKQGEKPGHVWINTSLHGDLNLGHETSGRSCRPVVYRSSTTVG